jgi:3-oxoacyl-[acyl-carrier-protein] synthase-3
MTFGLVSFGTSLGTPSPVDAVVGEYTDETARVLGYGYRTVYRCPPEVGVTDLATQAGARALDAAGIAPDEVDLVLLALTDIAEYLYWDASASLQHRLGLHRAEAVLSTQACIAGVAGFELIAGRFATRPHYRTALLVAGNRTCETYWNRMQTQSMVYSDAAVATVVRRDHPRNRWLVSETTTDGRYADFYRMQAGGAASPFTGAAGEPPRATDAWGILEHFDYDEDRFNDFVSQINQQARAVLERACARIDVRPQDLSRVLVPHDNVHSTRALAAALDLPVEVLDMAEGLEVGHVGAADQLLSLAGLVERGQLRPGDLVGLLGMARGMHWACTVMEI